MRKRDVVAVLFVALLLASALFAGIERQLGGYYGLAFVFYSCSFVFCVLVYLLLKDPPPS